MKDRRTELPMLRPPESETPCFKCAKQPGSLKMQERSRIHGGDVTPKSMKTFRHYRQCKAVGSFPHDPIVGRNAVVISDMIDVIEGSKMDQLLILLGGKVSYG